MSEEPVGLQAVQKRDLHLEVEARAAQNMGKEDGGYGKILKLQVEDIRVHVTTRFHIEGSALAGTLQSRALEFDSRVTVKSPEPPEKIARLIRVGENSCYVLQSLLHPVKVNNSVTQNGQPLELGAGG